MAFIEDNFSPIGDNARAGNVPQVFSYISNDTKALIVANGYFNDLGNRYLRRGDWIDIASDVDGTPGQSMNFVTGAGLTPSALSGVLGVGGSGYAVDDLVKVTYTDGTVVNNTIIKVLTVSTTTVLTFEIQDPGFFSKAPTSLGTLATAFLTGSGTGFTVTITLANEGEGVVTLSPLDLTAA